MSITRNIRVTFSVPHELVAWVAEHGQMGKGAADRWVRNHAHQLVEFELWAGDLYPDGPDSPPARHLFVTIPDEGTDPVSVYGALVVYDGLPVTREWW